MPVLTLPEVHDHTLTGVFEAADGGTLFLDAIGDLSLTLQQKLLRVLEQGQVFTPSARRPSRIDVRLLASTNMDLAQAVDASHFREDLFHRLNVASAMTQ